MINAISCCLFVGYFEVFMWLVDPNGGNCEIGSSACIDATFGGSVELLRWLKERGEGSWESNDMRAMLQVLVDSLFILFYYHAMSYYSFF